jgi:hypothetical protein
MEDSGLMKLSTHLAKATNCIRAFGSYREVCNLVEARQLTSVISPLSRLGLAVIVSLKLIRMH